MNTNTHKYPESKEKILKGLDMLAEPVIGTLTPKGNNVLLPNGQHTNDGATIAMAVTSEDPLEDMIINIVRQAALKTNSLVGDGTTTTILLTQAFIKEGYKLIDYGWNGMELAKELNLVSKDILSNINKLAHKVEDEESLMFVAKVSANGDEVIARDVVEAVTAVGEDGLIMIEDSPKPDTEVKKEQGFLISKGMFSNLLAKGGFSAQYKDVKILVTDKRIYHAKEAMDILTPLYQAGIRDVVIVARDFLGQSINVFLSNHTQGKMNILLVKDPDATDTDVSSLEDLAVYVGANFITDKAGRLTSTIKLEDFGTAERVVSDQFRTLISNSPSTELQIRTSSIKAEIEATNKMLLKDKLKARLARMTQGTVTIKVGGRTAPELRERIFRYEDSVNATRSAKKDGYVVGGGLTLNSAFIATDIRLSAILMLMDRVCTASLRQIATNCDLHFPTLMGEVTDNIGYNALSGEYENLHEAGIIEPVALIKAAFQNALSVALGILTSKYQIVEVKEKTNRTNGNITNNITPDPTN